ATIGRPARRVRLVELRARNERLQVLRRVLADVELRHLQVARAAVVRREDDALSVGRYVGLVRAIAFRQTHARALEACRALRAARQVEEIVEAVEVVERLD